MKNAQAAQRDFLAIILIGAGSSWARGSNRHDVVERVRKQVVDDWSSLFNLSGKTAEVNVYEIPDGFERVRWDDRGVWADGLDKPIDRLDLIEVVLPVRRKRR